MAFIDRWWCWQLICQPGFGNGIVHQVADERFTDHDLTRFVPIGLCTCVDATGVDESGAVEQNINRADGRGQVLERVHAFHHTPAETVEVRNVLVRLPGGAWMAHAFGRLWRDADGSAFDLTGALNGFGLRVTRCRVRVRGGGRSLRIDRAARPSRVVGWSSDPLASGASGRESGSSSTATR